MGPRPVVVTLGLSLLWFNDWLLRLQKQKDLDTYDWLVRASSTVKGSSLYELMCVSDSTFEGGSIPLVCAFIIALFRPLGLSS